VHLATEPQGKKYVAKFLPVFAIGKHKFDELTTAI
jgi:hypothetical protein